MPVILPATVFTLAMLPATVFTLAMEPATSATPVICAWVIVQSTIAGPATGCAVMLSNAKNLPARFAAAGRGPW